VNKNTRRSDAAGVSFWVIFPVRLRKADQLR
jgi:hypothetical protein